MEDSSRIQVMCRFRPLNKDEKQRQKFTQAQFHSDRQSFSIAPPNKTCQVFRFDHTFPPESTQQEVYNLAGLPLVQSVMEGYNGTVIAYGQTSSGKTFTMTGQDMQDEDSWGISPRAIQHLFQSIADSDPHIEFTIKCSYAEIYMETVRDLLDSDRAALKIKEDRVKGFYIENISEEYVNSEDEALDLLNYGSQRREVASTGLNEQSSRSHAIFMLTISQNHTVRWDAKSAKLYFVDLAGSEKSKLAHVEGVRMDECKQINKSLSALGNVIKGLTDSQNTHVPYRDSKLTKILKESLGGNSKTTMILTCSPSQNNIHETLSTIRFGQRAKTIKNKPVVNKEYTLSELKMMLAKAQETIQQKENQLCHLINFIKGAGVTPSSGCDLIEEIIADRKDENTYLKQELEKISTEMQNYNKANSALQNQIFDLTQQVIELEQALEEKDKSINEMISDMVLLENELQEMEKEKELQERRANETECQLLELYTRQSFDIDEIKQFTEAKAELISFKAKCEKLEYEVERLKEQLENQSDINTSINEDVSKERKSWKHERKQLMKDLYNRVDRVVQLEQQISEMNYKYKRLQETSNRKRKTELIHQDYDILVNQAQALLCEKSQ